MVVGDTGSQIWLPPRVTQGDMKNTDVSVLPQGVSLSWSLEKPGPG